MLHPYIPLTAEDSAIFESLPRTDRFDTHYNEALAFAIRKQAHRSDQNDARVMLDLGRAIHEGCGLTVRAWIMASLQSEQEAIRVEEFTEADFEHVVLASECPHGVNLDMLDDHPNACEHCYADDMERRAEHSAVPADWFAGGFAENH